MTADRRLAIGNPQASALNQRSSIGGHQAAIIGRLFE
jgi:hypothetical protein